MATIKIAIEDWPAFLKKLGSRALSAVQRGVVSGAQRSIPILQKRTEEAAPASANGASGAVNTGNYRGRWRVRALERGAMVFNDAPYAGVVDGGRRAGQRMPSKSVIEKWAMRRLGLSRKEARRAAFPIARAIAKRGLRPRRVLSGATAQISAAMAQEIKREINAEMRRP